MILLSLDFETTGLDLTNDRVIEVGAVLWSTGQHRVLESAGFLVKSDVAIPQEVVGITGIHQAAVERFGYDSHAALENVLAMAELAESFLGQNIVRFDHKVLLNWMVRESVPAPLIEKLRQKLVIDTYTDLPDFAGGKLKYMLVDAPRPSINPFQHAALTDALSAIVLVDQFDLDKVVERAKSPMIVVQSLHSRDRNEDAKKVLRPLIWNNLRKIWWKPLKAMDFEGLKVKSPFELIVRPDLNLDELERERG
jgi:hypothetical protein